MAANTLKASISSTLDAKWTPDCKAKGLQEAEAALVAEEEQVAKRPRKQAPKRDEPMDFGKAGWV